MTDGYGGYGYGVWILQPVPTPRTVPAVYGFLRWIDIAENVVREEWIDQYKDRSLDSSTSPADSDENGGKEQDAIEDFGNISLGMTSVMTDEFDKYLPLLVEPVKEPLRWWFSNKMKYPNLHCMVLDYLSVPATSTAVKRVFSQGRQLLHFTRNRLSGRSVHAFLCLGSWIRHDMVTMDDLVVVIRQKKRKRSEKD